jgi:putative methyltransferase (TIGR04325 family)
LILGKVRDSLLRVRNGQAVYERDSVLFDKTEYSWPLLAALLWCAARNKAHLNLLDFGGSLGSSYYQNRRFTRQLSSVRWNVVEQRNFVECGKRIFEDDELRFYFDVESCWHAQHPKLILFSSVLQYLEAPADVLETTLAYPFQFVLVDRTPFFVDDIPDRIAVQRVPERIYRASYPIRFFNEERFLRHFAKRYALVERFQGYEGAATVNGKEIVYRGFIFESKDGVPR